MIKMLFFTAALLVPSLACAQNPPSASFSDTVVAAGSDPTCDEGPAASTIPAPARAAGFTHCALNADFTSNTTDSNGINFGNTATYIDQCATGSLPAFHFALAFGFGPHGYPAADVAPCNHATITSDSAGGASQALSVIYTQADQAAYFANYCGNTRPCSGTQGDRTTALQWPVGYNAQSTPVMSPEYYVQFTMRVPQTSVTINTSIGSHTIPIELWNNAWNNSSYGQSPFQFEGNSTCASPCNNWQYGAGMGGADSTQDGYVIGPQLPNPNYVSNPANDWDSYHTWGFLITSDGTSHMGLCVYKDGVRQNCVELSNVPSQGMTAMLNNIDIWIGDAKCYEDAHTACLTGNPVQVFFTDIQVWACPNYASSACTGTLILSEDQKSERKQFSWYDKILNLFFSAAHADPFDGYPASPPGLRGRYWEACVPGREDCVWSPTGYIGKDQSHPPRAIRGPGYCYARQPFTCSPDGKVP